MTTLMFQPQFHSAILSGEKRQTIRRRRARPLRSGESLSLRAWSDKPYRSKQIELKRVICLDIEFITIDEDFADDDEARRDGFGNAAELRDWFKRVHGLPFHGERITWA
jgi:hypothetical protein